MPDSLDDEEENAFTMPEADVAPLAKALGATKAWLTEKKAAQEAKAAHEDPALTIKELKAKKKELDRLTSIVIQQQRVFENIKDQAEKAAAASSSKSAASASSASASSASASSAAEAKATPAEATPNATEGDVVEEKLEEKKVDEKDEKHDEL